ncbi:hypothetical protein PPL_06995 [Heterostelium album PN500]|uniref:Uncharacterized protein n=1 Tax=Heterostelium pallidum (strain ATCC 26659 / Pp 5 / PN500) TaxID=670386 RepID=D3BE42_HETP5|nr:hypothetical protein PPL_06995 [Heterostelium album PN500]EFA80173.1 hypothetical protein PPL_06995 [Heterostelium album PN500]|eukprot:XP_020432293.1 hypothetical protein PPL_06995 [Heterostelium album PN500]
MTKNCSNSNTKNNSYLFETINDESILDREFKESEHLMDTVMKLLNKVNKKHFPTNIRTDINNKTTTNKKE